MSDPKPQPKRKKITWWDYFWATESTPEVDDLERANCRLAGKPGHLQCGWDHDKNLPKTMC